MCLVVFFLTMQASKACGLRKMNYLTGSLTGGFVRYSIDSLRYANACAQRTSRNSSSHVLESWFMMFSPRRGRIYTVSPGSPSACDSTGPCHSTRPTASLPQLHRSFNSLNQILRFVVLFAWPCKRRRRASKISQSQQLRSLWACHVSKPSRHSIR